jgi:hypothetical protein
VAAAFVAVAATGSGLSSSVRRPGERRGPAAVTTTPDSGSPRPGRPFEHRRHERVSCRSCHGTGAEHRTILVRTPRDCAGCHHDERRAQACADCHGTERLPQPAPVAAAMSLSVWDSARTRALPFNHDVHARGGAGLTCRDCHRTPVTLARDRACASCHTEHHRPEATCATCHLPTKQGTHTPEVHLSCAGAGCHAPAVAPPPTLSRTLCLTCHAAQKEHEPGGTCAACHRIPDGKPRRAAGTGAAQREAVR